MSFNSNISRVKLYKAGKKWVAALLISGSIAGIGIASSQVNPQVNAATTQTKQISHTSQNSEVNTSDLERVTLQAKSTLSESSDYTAGSISNLHQAVNEANEIMSEPAGKRQAGVNHAAGVVQKALWGLQEKNPTASNSQHPGIDDSSLQSVENQGEDVLINHSTEYTPTSINQLFASLENAEEILQGQNGFTQSGTDRATAKIQAGLDGLQKA